MDLQKRRTFIISFIYFAIIGVICYILFKRLIPMLMPFIMALAIAAALDPAVSYLGSRMKGGYRCAAAAVLLLFYGCLFSLAAVSGNWLFSCIQEQGRKLPALYGEVMEPGLSRFSHFWKPASLVTASISPRLEPVWSMPWKMQQAPFLPA